MTFVLILLLTNAAIGAFDTLYFHEYKAQLPRNLEHTRTELRLHAARDAIYFVVYGVLSFWQITGLLAGLLLAALAAEIAITLADFVVEDRDRAALGGMPAGERVAHTVMAIVYGAMLAQLLPLLVGAIDDPTGWHYHDAPVALSMATLASAVGIACTGVRDTAALYGILPEERFLATRAR